MNYACRTGFQPATLWQIVKDLDRSFNDVPEKASAPGAWVPAIDVTETPAAFVVVADLPGIKRDDFELEVIGDTLTIKGTRKNGEAPESARRHRTERGHGAFERTFRFAENIQTDKVQASFEDGVLQVTLPKPEQAQPRKIEVRFN